MQGEVVASSGELGGHGHPEGGKGGLGEQEEASGEGGEARRSLARPARPQAPPPPPQHKRAHPNPQLRHSVEHQPQQGHPARPVEGPEHPGIEELVRQRVEELPQEGGALPAGHPAVQNVRGQAQEEEKECQSAALGQHGPHQGADEEEAQRGQGVCHRHDQILRAGTVKIIASLI